MNKTITLTESELKSLIKEAVEENWWKRNFGGKQSRGNTQLADAQNLIAQSDEAIEQYKQMVSSGQAGNGAEYKSLAQAFNLRAKAYGYIARSASNGVPSNFSDSLLNIQGGQMGNQGGQYATNWRQAEAEINQVVKGNFANWPQQCKQAGWPDDKIAAYRQLANQNARNRKATPAQQPAAPQQPEAPQQPAQQPEAPQQQAAPAPQQPAAPQKPWLQNTSQTQVPYQPGVQPDNTSLQEAIINRVVKNFYKNIR